MNKFSERLKELRTEKGLSQKQLADELMVSQTHISKLELKQRQPNIEQIIFLCKFFQVSADYLLGIID